MKSLMIEVAPQVFTDVYFAAQGPKLFVWHNGTPSARPLSPTMLEVFAKHGFSVASPLRPGYGDSSYQPARSFEADAANTAKVVSELGFERYITCGYSGGGPRALADLAFNDSAVAGIIVAGTAPYFDSEVDWLAGADPSEIEAFTALIEHGEEARPNFEKWLPDLKAFNLQTFLAQNEGDAPLIAWTETPDAQFRFNQPSKTFDQGVTGWMLDEIALARPWGFDPSVISKPTFIWTGDRDKNVDAMCSRWMHDKIAGSKLTVLPGFEHTRIWSVETLEQMLAQLNENLVF